MNITTYRGEANLDALAKRIFGDALQQHPDWLDRLVRANPHLSNLKSLPNGTPIVVPVDDVPGAADDPSRHLANDRLLDALDMLEARQTAKLAEREAALQETSALASSSDLAAAAGNDQALAGRIATITEDTQNRLTQVAADRKALSAALASARAAAGAAPQAALQAVPPPIRRRPSGKP